VHRRCSLPRMVAPVDALKVVETNFSRWVYWNRN